MFVRPKNDARNAVSEDERSDTSSAILVCLGPWSVITILTYAQPAEKPNRCLLFTVPLLLINT